MPLSEAAVRGFTQLIIGKYFIKVRKNIDLKSSRSHKDWRCRSGLSSLVFIKQIFYWFRSKYLCLKTTNKNVIRKITNEILLRLRTTTSLLTLSSKVKAAASALFEVFTHYQLCKTSDGEIGLWFEIGSK